MRSRRRRREPVRSGRRSFLVGGRGLSSSLPPPAGSSSPSSAEGSLPAGSSELPPTPLSAMLSEGSPAVSSSPSSPANAPSSSPAGVSSPSAASLFSSDGASSSASTPSSSTAEEPSSWLPPSGGPPLPLWTGSRRATRLRYYFRPRARSSRSEASASDPRRRLKTCPPSTPAVNRMCSAMSSTLSQTMRDASKHHTTSQVGSLSKSKAALPTPA